MNITVEVPTDKMNNVTEENFTAVVNVYNFTEPGKYELVPVSLQLPEDVVMVGDSPSVTVTVTEDTAKQKPTAKEKNK